MATEARYQKFIVQSLVGNSTWSSVQRGGAYYHAGTIQNKKNQTFVSDLRVMVSATKDGFQPLAVYARRAQSPLLSRLPPQTDSWSMLGTNLSELNKETGEWSTDTSRLLLMDMKDFNKLGIAIDELIDAYVQTCLATLAIDRMACRLTKKNGVFGPTAHTKHKGVELQRARSILSLLARSLCAHTSLSACCACCVLGCVSSQTRSCTRL